MPAVGCSAPPCLPAAPRFRAAVVRWQWCVVCVVLPRRSARPRSGLWLVAGGPLSAAASLQFLGLAPPGPPVCRPRTFAWQRLATGSARPARASLARPGAASSARRR
eukprot:1597554-Alexandrium_andersonii.AAC.1